MESRRRAWQARYDWYNQPLPSDDAVFWPKWFKVLKNGADA
jgi:hypothetical protein